VYCCTTCQPLQLNIGAAAAAAAAAGSAAAAAAAAEAGSSKKAVSRKRSSKQESRAAAAGPAAAAAVGDDADVAARQLLSPARLKSMAAAQVAKVGVLIVGGIRKSLSLFGIVH
jgi:hypothetical protein